MKQFQILRYLKKYTVFIAAGSVAAGLLFYFVIQYRMQSYTAGTVIEYTNSEASKGRAFDGTDIDPSEIKASHIVSQAMENLNFNMSTANMDEIRRSIYIEPIISEEDQKTRDAKIDLGESYDVEPTRYWVSFTSDVRSGREFPRKVLNEILDVYIAYYGENHVNLKGGSNGINDIYSKGYDYIEMMEVIDASLKETLATLEDKMEMNNGYRSYDTGYAFVDLYNEFNLLKNIEVPKITADILNRTITKNRDVLVAKYKNRNNDLEISNDVWSKETEKIIQIIESYVTLMSKSDNTDMTAEYILEDIEDNYGYDAEGNALKGTDQTTEYDRLLEDYVSNRTGYEQNIIDRAYNEYIINTFRTAPAASADTVRKEAEDSIYALVTKINDLYKILDLTNDEYNEFLGANNIVVLSSVGVSENMPVRLFTVFVVLIFGVLGCLGAIIIGRIGDIVDYYAFTSKLVGLPNRAKCDRYIASMEKDVLPGQFLCIVFRIKNLKEENIRLGRSAGDMMMKIFTEALTGVFIPSDDVFVGDNGSGQYLVFASGVTKERGDGAVSQIHTLVKQRCEGEAFDIEIEEGLACAQDEECYYIRKLLSIAMSRLGGAQEAPVQPEEKTVQSGEKPAQPEEKK